MAVNTDDCSKGNSGPSACTGVFRNELRRWCGWFELSLSRCGSSEAEVWGIFKALLLAWDKESHPWRRNRQCYRKNTTIVEPPPPVKSEAEILQEIEDLGLMKVIELGADEANARIKRVGKPKHLMGITYTGVHFLSIITFDV
ncbi:uncharacterized protein LOC119370541 [Jatropha curcas]|uniref:uncharacterized protein LOC119370541 n=1 Tax=Jatropha curcas TaxID=180498 RepID=UPI0018953660|nr:uncharacterized protein LOC119370541 [Jatropha curcas]